MIRSNKQLVDDLFSLPASEWNKSLADEYGISVDTLKEIVFGGSDEVSMSDASINAAIKKAMPTVTEAVDIMNTDEIIPKNMIHTFVRQADPDDVGPCEVLEGSIVVGIDFTDCDLSQSCFITCAFYNCSFTGAIMSYSTFIDSVFSSCNMDNVKLGGSHFIKSRFSGTSMAFALIEDTDFNDCILYRCNLMNADADDSRFISVGMHDSNMSYASFKRSYMCSNILSFVVAKGANFDRSTIVDSRYMKCDFKNSTFEDAVPQMITADSVEFDEKYSYVFVDNIDDEDVDQQQFDDDDDEDEDDDG